AVPAVLLLPYPFTNLVLDVVLLFLYLGTEATRIFFAILNTILLLFYAVELLLGVLALVSFSSVDSY
ncbi:PREDICTED: transmembrane protein 216-like, partial [Tauraco erythrolophus]|uniref:transmembrane protein 216-like n=1 Tax=Tauraco erythrolophus TaxID=121530 RepID=UPI00052393D5